MSPWRSEAAPPPLVDPRGLWARRLVALLVGGVAGAVVVGLVLRMPLDALDTNEVDLPIWLLTGALLLLNGRWRPRRRRRLVWQARVAGLHGFAPGLVARRSVAGWAQVVGEIGIVLLLPLMLLAVLPDREWTRVVHVVVAAAAGMSAGRVVYDVARFTGALALTADGIRQERRWHDWSNIDEIRLNRADGHVDGVYLRPRVWRPTGRERVVGGRTVAVPDERLLAAIDHYRTRSEALAVGLPVTSPEPADAHLPR
ncbi:hypothetical protein ACTMSW_00445 [Micromonospora sp. BQ11]|uniref:hypothetical protein n=1 Tax=Micromonospora sp. BQ11 TaxID=3452212 RepID=UPI003F8CCB1B